MDVDVELLVEVLLQAYFCCAAPYVGHCRLGRLLHYFAELARDDELAPAGHERYLYGQQLSADLCPRKAGCHAYLVIGFDHAVPVLRHAEILGQRLHCDSDFRFPALLEDLLG